MEAYAKKTDLSNTAAGKGTDSIGLYDPSLHFVGTTAGDALRELGSKMIRKIFIDAVANETVEIPRTSYFGGLVLVNAQKSGTASTGNAFVKGFLVIKGSWNNGSMASFPLGGSSNYGDITDIEVSVTYGTGNILIMYSSSTVPTQRLIVELIGTEIGF